MDISKPTSFVHASLYWNAMCSSVMLKMSIFLSIVSIMMNNKESTIFSLSCICISISVQYLAINLNSQLRSVLSKEPRSREKLYDELNLVSRDNYNFGQPENVKLGDYVYKKIMITFYLSIIGTITMYISIVCLIMTFIQISWCGWVLIPSLGVIEYAMYEILANYNLNRSNHVNWFYKK